jgi:hypothetical protein
VRRFDEGSCFTTIEAVGFADPMSDVGLQGIRGAEETTRFIEVSGTCMSSGQRVEGE